MHTKDITVKNLNEAVSALGALLSVREFFFKIANDLQVMFYKNYSLFLIENHNSFFGLDMKHSMQNLFYRILGG